MPDSPCVQNGTEHVWGEYGNACQVEGCRWFRGVEAPRRRRAPRRPSPSGTGLENLLSFGA